MTNKYNWEVLALDCYPQKAGETNVVFNIHWILRGTDGINNASVYGAKDVGLEDGTPFTPYDSLTLEQVTGWLTSSLGEEQIKALQSNIDGQIDILANPSSASTITQITLPWVKGDIPTTI